VKAKIISDQHLEFRASGPYRKYFNAIHPANGDVADVCIVAGDFDVIARKSRGFFQELCDLEKHVLFVPGNHEYYGCRDMAAVDDALREIEQAISNLTILRAGEMFEFLGQRFLGDTMWVPMTADVVLSRDQVNDGREIPDLLDQIGERHQRFVDWLCAELRPGDVVVTHHLPSNRSTPPRHKESPAQPWFVARDAETLFVKQPRAWIHGHTHTRCDYVLSETRVLCNPVGYPNETGKLPGRLAPFRFEL
jgi:Icc-related predicted phosphoesterase